MTIEKYICSKNEISEQVRLLLNSEFDINEAYSQWLKTEIIDKHINEFIDSIYALIETPYVDKVYRDSYYNYFSSKLGKYNRDCIRISFFNGEIQDEMFQNNDKISDLQERFLGFIIIRPTEPNLIGRSVLSPKIKKETNFSICTVNISTTVNCVKFNIEGFPHSSQDTETISCAETTIWALMEYFGNKYPDYKPVLPSRIISTLNKVSYERQIPSKGLNIQQISFALKEFGFGTRIYSKIQFGKDFTKLLSCYVESGIPIIVALENNKRTIGHAMLCIGHCKIDDTQIDTLNEESILFPALQKIINDKGIKFFDYDSIEKDFIFVDDNHAIYQKAHLENPAQYYGITDWDTCEITHFIVPLYPKIYLDAFEAKSFIMNFLFLGHLTIPVNSELFIRFFLTSSRSYKNAISLDANFNDEIKAIINETAMPKFIWVAELSTKNNLKQGVANGIVIIDATEAKIFYLKPLLLAIYNDEMINFDSSNKAIAKNSIPLYKNKIYSNNFRAF